MKKDLFKTLLIIFFCAIGTSRSAISSILIESDPKKYIIQSSFKYNKEIWGTYSQVFESGHKVDLRGKKTRRNIAELPISSIIFRKGKLYLIRPIQEKNSIAMEVLGLPYKKIRKNIYKVETRGKEFELFNIFKDHIHSMLEKGFYRDENIHTVSIEDIIFSQITCTKRKSLFHCRLPLEFKNGNKVILQTSRNKNFSKNSLTFNVRKNNQKALLHKMKRFLNNSPLFRQFLSKPDSDDFQKEKKGDPLRRVPSNKNLH